MRYLGLLLAILALLVMGAFVSYRENAGVMPPTAPDLTAITPDNAPNLQEVARYGSGFLTGAFAWSLDGRTLAVGSTLGIWFYDMTQPDQLPTLLDLDTSVSDIAYTSDGRHLAYVTSAGVHIMDIVSAQVVFTIENANVVEAHPEANQIVVAQRYSEQYEGGNALFYSKAEIWNISNQQMVMSFEAENIKARMMRINDLAFSPNGRYLAVSFIGTPEDTCGNRSATMQMWDVENPAEHPVTVGEAEQGIFSPDTEWLISRDAPYMSFDTAYFRPYKMGQGEIEAFNTDPNQQDDWGYTSDFAFDPNNGQFVTVHDDNLRFWDTESRTMLREISSATAMYWLSFSPDGARAVTASSTTLELWTDDFSQHQLLPFDALYLDITFLQSGDGFVERDAENRLHLWRIEGTQLVETFVSEPLADETPIISFDGHYIASRSGDLVQLWNTESTADTPVILENNLIPIAFSRDEQFLLTTYVSDSVSYLRIHDTHQGTQIQELNVGEYPIFHARMSNDNSRIFVAVGTDEYLTQFLDVIYDVATATPIFEHVHDARPGGSITPAMDYYILGGGYFGSVIGVLDIETGETVSQPTQHSYGGNIHEISADGQFLVFMTTSVSHCGGDYRQIFVYRLPSLELVISGGLPSMYGLGGNTADGRLNHDATLFVSVNNVYSTATAEIIAQIPSSHDLVFSSDGTRLILFRQGTIRIWGVVASPE